MHSIYCRTAYTRTRNGEQLLITPGPCPACAVASVPPGIPSTTATPATTHPAPTHPPVLPAEAGISPGTRPGFVEITFPFKPATVETLALKRAGFHFTTSDNRPRWYGKVEKTPPSYRQGVAALMDLCGIESAS